MKIRTLKPSDVTFTLECLAEDTPVRGNAMASGDDATDREAEDWVNCQLRDGNEWAWCTVKVTAEWQTFRGVAYLGCCSYLSEEDFRVGGYYESMKDEALDDLNESIERIAKALPLEDI
jgi:hypothetical protein